jgi:hypothetical protein
MITRNTIPESFNIFNTTCYAYAQSKILYAKSLEPFCTSKRNRTSIAFPIKISDGTYLFSAALSRVDNIILVVSHFWDGKQGKK